MRMMQDYRYDLLLTGDMQTARKISATGMQNLEKQNFDPCRQEKQVSLDGDTYLNTSIRSSKVEFSKASLS